MEDALREHKTKSSEQEKQIEELTRKVSQLEREKETLEGGLEYLAITCHVIITWYIHCTDDLEAAEEKYEKAKKELESTLAELNEIWTCQKVLGV